jgi:DNA-binding transcriptional LysR family regulator
MENLMDGEEMLKRLVDMDMGEVRIGASDMTLQFYLLPYLETFHERYPNIKVMVSNAPTPETIESLYEGKIDFGVVSTPFDARPEVESFVAGNKFWTLKGKRMEYRELEHLPCIFLEKDTSTRKFMDRFLEQRGIILEPEFELATSDMIVQFAIRNMGIGCVMEEFAKEKIESGELFELAFREMMPEREICVVTDKKVPISPAGERFLEVLRERKV